MSQQSLDYQSADVSRRSPVKRATVILAGVILLVNGFLLAIAAADQGWGALGIAVLIGPITNGVLLLISLTVLPAIKRGGSMESVGTYLAVSICMPIAAVILDFLIVVAISPHGC
jgi:hypothetical protein